MRKKVIVGAALAACCVTGIGWFSDGQKAVGEQVTVVRGDITQNVMLAGVLKPSRKVKVGAQVTGQLKKLYVHEGMQVKQGDLLAEIDPAIQESDLRIAQAGLSRAIAQKESSRIMMTQYRQEYLRQKRMRKDDATATKDLEQAQAQYNAQQQQLVIDEASVVQAEMEVESAKTNLSYTRIVAPISGDVLAIVTEEGQTIVSSQTATTLLVLATLDSMIVSMNIPEADVLKVKPGQPVSATITASPGEIWRGEMGRIQNAPDAEFKDDTSMGGMPNNPSEPVLYNGIFEIDNACRCLKTAMSAQVSVITAERKGVLTLPLSVIGSRNADGQVQVLKNENGQPVPVWVTPGVADSQSIEIVSGLAEGDRVFIPSDERH